MARVFCWLEAGIGDSDDDDEGSIGEAAESDGAEP
jgi:hypothetical protein